MLPQVGSTEQVSKRRTPLFRGILLKAQHLGETQASLYSVCTGQSPEMPQPHKEDFSTFKSAGGTFPFFGAICSIILTA